MNSNFDAGVNYSLFYAFVFLMALLFGAFGEMSQKRKKIYTIVTFFVFFIVMGFRSIDMGNDTITYVQVFDNITSASLQNALEWTSMERGYVIYNWIIGKIFHDPRFLLLITAAIINISIGRFVYKYVDCPGLFSCIFLGLMRFDFFMSAMRQALSIAIILYALDFLINKKTIKFFLLTIFACSFHTSSVIVLIIYPLIKKVFNQKETISRKNLSFYFSMFFFMFACSLFLDRIAIRVMMLFPRYASYLGSRSFEGEPRLAAILATFAYATFFVIPKVAVKNNRADVKLYSLTERLSFLTVAISFVSINATIISRLSSTFCLFVFMFFSNCFRFFKKEEKAFWIYIVILCAFAYGLILVLYKTPSWQTTYPIELCWEL